jgi:NitT/TauT family transport system substrate-binding protein
MTKQLIRLWLACAALGAGARAAEPITLYLNWSPSVDHAPFYLAKARGWYKDAGIEFSIERGAGSYATVQKVATAENAAGIADLTSVLVARGSGIRTVAIMNVFANSPYALYWTRSSGIRGLRDMGGRKFGGLPNDPTRVLWAAFAKVNNMVANAVWVDVGPNAKAQALKEKAIEVAPNAYPYQELAFEALLGGDLRELKWRDAGVNLYSNSLIVEPSIAEEKPHLARALAQVTQRAFVDCLANPASCIDAFVVANPAMNRPLELKKWNLLRDVIVPHEAAQAFGAFDANRLKRDYDMVKEAFNFREDFDPAATATNDFLDAQIKVDAPAR